MDPITQKLVPGAAGFVPNKYANDVFSVDTWLGTGTGASTPANKKITNGINMAEHGGMVLNFQRGNLSGTYGNSCYKGFSDTDIGVQKRIWPSSGTNAGAATQSDAMQSFDSDGWTMGVNIFMNEGNGDGSNSSSNGAFTFRKCPGFFDMVTFTTGDASGKDSYRRINHSLKCKPGFWILKDLGANTGDFYVYLNKRGRSWYAKLNTTDDFSQDNNFWGYTDPTTTDFGVNESAPWWTANTSYRVWLWADGDDPDAAIFGENSDAPIVKQVSGGGGVNAFTDIGWEPQMLLIKNSGSDWCWFDTLRGTAFQSSGDSFAPFNGVSMFSNNTGGDSAGYGIGFNHKGWYNSTFGGTCYCLAIRRPDGDCGRFAQNAAECLHIHQGAEPSTENFNLNTIVDGSNNPTGFGIQDMEISGRRYGGTTNWYNTNRMMSGSSNNEGGMSTANNESGFSRYYLSTTNDAYLSQQQASLRNIRYDLNSVQLTATPPVRGAYIPPDGWGNNSGGAGQNSIFYMFKRQPGFFDMIKYNGYTDVPTTHKLGVIPDLVIVKSLTNNSSSSYGNYWGVWSKAAADANIGVSAPTLNYHAWFNHVNSVQAQGFNLWSTVPTATTLDIATGHPNDSNVTTMMYLFANREGVSKFGIYTGLGSGNAVTVSEIGFSPRLLMIKNLTTSGGQDYWFVYDTKRGFTSSNSPYLILNEQNSEVTGTDYVDPISNGFEITNSAIDNFNRNGDKFLYLAFA